MGVAKKIVIAILVLVSAAVLVVLPWSSANIAKQSINPWQLSATSAPAAIEAWVNDADNPDNLAAYTYNTDTKNNWGNVKEKIEPTLDYYGNVVRKVTNYTAPWDENSNAYYAETDINGTTITVYSPDADAHDVGWSVNQTYDVAISVPEEGLIWSDDLSDSEKNNIIRQAVALYWNANTKYVEAPAAGYYSICFTNNYAAGLNNRVNLDILEVRNGGEYYRQDYRVDGGIDLFKTLGEKTFESLELTCAERRYCNKNMTKTLYYKSPSAKIIDSLPMVDWSKESPNDPVDIGVYSPQTFSGKSSESFAYKFQNKAGAEATNFDGADKYTLTGYQKCAHIISCDTLFDGFSDGDTVKSASITRNSYGGLFVELELNLDDTRATSKTVAGIRNGSGDQTADYTSIVVKFDLWSNGMYMTYGQNEKWEAPKVAGGIVGVVSSTFLYSDVFFYGEEDCDVDKYVEYWDDAKAASAEYNA
jgi:hypothetical protein